MSTLVEAFNGAKPSTQVSLHCRGVLCLVQRSCNVQNDESSELLSDVLDTRRVDTDEERGYLRCYPVGQCPRLLLGH